MTFGSKFNLEKLMNCRAMQIAWRVRPGLSSCHLSDPAEVGAIEAKHEAGSSAAGVRPERTIRAGRITDRPGYVVGRWPQTASDTYDHDPNIFPRKPFSAHLVSESLLSAFAALPRSRCGNALFSQSLCQFCFEVSY